MPTRILLQILILATFGSTWSAPKGRSGKPPLAAQSGAPSSLGAPLPLDQEMVAKYYNEGDFDPAIAKLEEFQRTHSRFTRAESVMVYKYLGVMYSADPQTREKGKSYFYKLLKVDPEAKILDMYVSIVVQEIFRSTLEELMGGMPISRDSRDSQAVAPSAVAAKSSRAKPGEAPSKERTAEKPRDGGPEGKLRASEGRGHALLWWFGVGALATAGGGYYLYSRNGTQPRDTEIVATP